MRAGSSSTPRSTSESARCPAHQSYIEHESYLAFCVAITFLTLGIVGILGSDDILSCFVVGNVMNWDDSYREGSEGQAFQEVIDSLLNSVSAPLLPR